MVIRLEVEIDEAVYWAAYEDGGDAALYNLFQTDYMQVFSFQFVRESVGRTRDEFQRVRIDAPFEE